jgi:hypothetical protein
MNMNAFMPQRQIAAIATTNADPLEPLSALSSVIATGSSFAPKSSLLFIDAGVTDWQSLATATTSATEVHFLRSDADADAIAQITQTLLGRSGIESVAIVSHGKSGGLQLGENWLNASNLSNYATQLRSWGSALTAQADILLYGCEVGADTAGQGFMNLLAQATGADVAASDDLTGNAAFGGDWDLEVATGGIETVGSLNVDRLAGFRGTLNWQQLGLDIDGEAAGDSSGYSVAVSDDGLTVVTGAFFGKNTSGIQTGHARVFRFSNNAWTQLGADIDGEGDIDFFGHASSISSDGNTVAIGGFGNDGNGSNSGHVRIFRFSNNAWTQLGSDIDGEAADDRIGVAKSISLSADGNTIVVGGFGNDGNGTNSGHTRIFRFNNNAWTQVGSDIDGEAAGDNSGTSVSLSADGNTLAIGATGNDGNGSNSGHVRIFRLDGTTWTQVGSDINGEAADDNSGGSVSLSADGNTVAIGAQLNDANGVNSGHVRIFRLGGTAWTQVGSDIDGEAASDFSAESVSLSDDGNTVVIGSINNSGNGSKSGHARIYRLNNNAWTQLGLDINGEAADDNSGKSVALSADGNTVAIGASLNDGNGANSGHVRIYRFSASGLPTPPPSPTPPPLNNGLSEVLARNKVTGEITILYTDPATQQPVQRSLTYGMNFGALAGQVAKITADWTVSDTADFNGDRIADILLHNKTGDEVAIWLLGANGTITQAASLQQNSQTLRTQNTNWLVVGFADLDRDNILDLVWHNRESDEVGIWFMNADGINVRAYEYLREANGQVLKTNNKLWQIDGLSDFDGDGDMDLLYRLPELNQTAIVRLNGKTVVDYQFITSNSEPSLVIDQVADSDGNGTADIYWRNPVNNTLFIQPIALSNNIWQSLSFNPVPGATKSIQAILNAQGQTIQLDLNLWELLEVDDFGRFGN